MKTFKVTFASYLAVLLTSLLGATSFSQDRSSGLFLEPGITYEVGSTKTSLSAWSNGILKDSTGTANGVGLLGRAGLHVNETFFIALDGRYSFLTYKDSTNNQKSAAKSFTVAPLIGIQMPTYGLRIWAGYIAASQLDPAKSGDYDFKFRDGSGLLIGGGFRIQSVSLNLDYKRVTYRKADAQSLPFGFSANDRDIRTDDNAWIASLTFPVQL